MGGYAHSTSGAPMRVTRRVHGDRAGARRAAPSARAARARCRRGRRDEAAPQAPGHRRRASSAQSASPPRWCSNAFQSNLVFFYSPSQVAAHEAPSARTFRLGGLVEEGHASSATAPSASFVVTDTAQVDPGALRGHPSRPVQGGQGRRRAGPARGRRVRRPRGARQARRELHAARSRRSAEAAQQGNPSSPSRCRRDDAK